ncbi:MAG: HAD family hydrolase, partial [Dehalococcoidia bacterium]|nr:HAD family hydrolase [Dehalococcoidia bacterium]
MAPSVRAVTLDLWETLILDPAPEADRRSIARIERITQALDEAGWPYPQERVAVAYHRAFTAIAERWAQDLEMPCDEQVAGLLDALDPTLRRRLHQGDLDSVTRAYVEPIYDMPPPLAPYALDAIDALRDSGYRLGLICNTGRTPGPAMRLLLARYDVLRRLDTAAFSDEEGIRKPRVELFHRVAHRLGVDPRETVHVGDNPRDDIEGAIDAGMRAVLIGAKPPTVRP